MHIVIVDDHPLTCAGLNILLVTAFASAQVESFYAVAEARQRLEQAVAVDWIFLDIRLPDDPDGQLFAWLRDNGLVAKVILISAEMDVEVLRDALAAGARGFIPKSADPELLLQGFAAIRAGEVFLPERLRTLVAAGREATLSPRKEAVYQLLLKGLSNKAIARELGLSEYTVKEYVSSIFVTRGVTNRLELLLKDAPGRGAGRS